MSCYKKVIDFIYNYIFYSIHRCYVCKEIMYETGNCECWYNDWKKD